MKISSKGDYALRTLLTLAMRNGDTRPIRLPEIASANNIPVKFLEQIMIQLKSGGLVNSRRGRHGGYLLARDPREITLGEVIQLIDGSISPIGCVSERDRINCTFEKLCVLRKIFLKVRLQICEIVNTITFQDLCDMMEHEDENGQGVIAPEPPPETPPNPLNSGLSQPEAAQVEEEKPAKEMELGADGG